MFSWITDTIKKSTSLKNITILSTGTLIAQLIPLITSPLLTRLYAPEDFGLLALFISIFALIYSFSNLRYDQAIIQCKNEIDAIKLTWLSIVVIIIITFVLILIVVIFNSSMARASGNEKIGPWLYLLPLFVFIKGTYSALRFYSIREGRYSLISKTSIYKSISLAVFNIGFGIINLKHIGLITAQFISIITGNHTLGKDFLSKKSVFLKMPIKEYKLLLRKYLHFPIYGMPGELIYTYSQNIIVLYLSFFFGSKILGYFALVNRTMGIPMQFIGNAFSDVYMQMAAKEKNTNGNSINAFNKTIKGLLIICILIFPLLAIFSPFLYSLFFGEQWLIAGKFAQIMIAGVALKFIAIPISKALIIYQKQKLLLGIQFITFIIIATSLFLAHMLRLTENMVLMVFTIGIVITQLILILATWLVVRNYKIKDLWKTILLKKDTKQI